MKFYKKSNTYKNSTGSLTFDLTTGKGYSYDWYRIIERLGDIYALNTYNYSPSTIKHISRIRSILNELNLKYVTLDAPNGLDRSESINNHYNHLIDMNNKKIAKPRTQTKTKARLFEENKVLGNKLLLAKLITECRENKVSLSVPLAKLNLVDLNVQ